MKRFIVTKKQLNEYIEMKKADNIFYDIIYDIYKNGKYLKENVSLEKANQNIIDKYNKKKLINTRVNESLIKFGIIDNNTKII